MMTNDTVSVPSGGINPYSAATSVIGAIGGIYDTYQSNKTARQNTDKTIAANKAEAELAYKRNLEMWNLQNAYNDPKAQMARYQGAGLNPNLMYGQGNSGNANTPPAYQPPHIQYQYQAGKYGAAAASVIPMMMNVGEWVQNMRIKEAQLKGIQTETALKTNKAQSAVQTYRYLEQAHPEMLRKLQKGNTLIARQAEGQLLKNSQLSWAEDAAIMKLITEYGGEYQNIKPNMKLGGMAAERYKKLSAESQKAVYDMHLKRAQASWTDYDITNPQALVQMVLGGAMHAATGLSLNAMKRKVPQKQTPRKTGQSTSNFYDKKGRKTGSQIDYEYGN